MVEFCDNPKTTVHVNSWRGKKDQTAASLLIKLWRKEEKELGVKRDKHGKIIGEYLLLLVEAIRCIFFKRSLKDIGQYKDFYTFV